MYTHTQVIISNRAFLNYYLYTYVNISKWVGLRFTFVHIFHCKIYETDLGQESILKVSA
jgi:hypothetical protein